MIYLYRTQKYIKKTFHPHQKQIITAHRIIKQLECNENAGNEEYIQKCEETSYITAISKTEKQLENASKNALRK
jgi:cytochrome b involved in lipid metabolism